MDVLPMEVSDPQLNSRALRLLHPRGSHRSLPVWHLPSFLQGFSIQRKGRLGQASQQERRRVEGDTPTPKPCCPSHPNPAGRDQASPRAPGWFPPADSKARVWHGVVVARPCPSSPAPGVTARRWQGKGCLFPAQVSPLAGSILKLPWLVEEEEEREEEEGVGCFSPRPLSLLGLMLWVSVGMSSCRISFTSHRSGGGWAWMRRFGAKSSQAGSRAGAGALPPAAHKHRSSPGCSRLWTLRTSSGAAAKTGLRRGFLQQIFLQGARMAKARSNPAQAAQAARTPGVGWGSAAACDGERRIPAAVGWQNLTSLRYHLMIALHLSCWPSPRPSPSSLLLYLVIATAKFCY